MQDTRKFTEGYIEYWVVGNLMCIDVYGVKFTQQDLENMLEELKKAKESV